MGTPVTSGNTPSTLDSNVTTWVDVDDKLPIVIPFILSFLAAHHQENPDRTFFVGLNGVQGIGKTSLVSALANALQARLRDPGSETVLVLSIDDFYLPRDEQLRLAAAHPDNALVQVRGQPSTHDIPLLSSVLAALAASEPVKLPKYDKAAHSGSGDRLPSSAWPLVNGVTQGCCRIVLLEGWCVGFRSLPDETIASIWSTSSTPPSFPPLPPRKPMTLQNHLLSHLLLINSALRRDYESIWDLYCGDAFVHLDADDTSYVYAWRAEQEAWLRRRQGETNAMSEAQVRCFVDAYYPAYELYAAGVRKGVFEGRQGRNGRQLRLVIDRERRVKKHMVI